ncbi:MAG TPA: transporter substrate-binding domain-containing protein [Alphaproteobacteria bacterium]|nr:transporter substrate-binding domain-containing protein [Alphaproteobacteria bacterium]
MARADGSGAVRLGRRRMCRLLALLPLALAAAPAWAQGESWVVLSDIDFPPYNFTAEGRRTGLDTEIVEAVLARIGVTPQHRPLPWRRVQESMEAGEGDMAFQFVGRPDRFERFNVVGPIRQGVTVFAVRADSDIRYERLEDLTGLRIGTSAGFTYTQAFDSAAFLTKEEAPHTEANLRKLAHGRVDAVIGDLTTIAWLLGQLDLRDRIKILPRPHAEVPRYVLFPKSRTDRADRFAAALQALKDDGTLERIAARWLGGAKP